MSGHEKGWVGAGPAGLVALAMACFTFFALLTGRVEHSAIPLLGIWLLAGFVVQIVTALLELKEGNLLGAMYLHSFRHFYAGQAGLTLV